ncbi:unnamed protein product [Darwinula stevensoni]|uniref:AAA+ ATPase domain-containing protein n=1 Tax=Darwinula stevensoni TaxID=69355 RepID=A0A7R9A2M9_9CRUS|nr:unnamed protein product [Darwinula stevensoni]CAG0886001.1 unnamed protein product [Darwinula stevensoni]
MGKGRDQSGKSKPYIFDPKLIPRICQYLDANSNRRYVDVDDIVKFLQGRFPEYARRKRLVLRKSVEKAYHVIQNEAGGGAASESSHTDDEDSIDEPLNEVLEELQEVNSMNNSISSLYAKGDKNSSEIPEILILDDEGSKSKQSQGSLKHKLAISSSEPSSKKRKTKNEVRPMESSVTFADLGGIDSCKEEICKLLVHLRHPEVYRHLGITPPRGFLLHGPPGCGKTLLSHAIAGELKLPLLKIAATEIICGVSGDSEEKIRDLFDQAVSCAPCILFIDEVDAVTPKRETAQREMERRIVSQLLACLDELGHRENGDQVLVIGATNRPDSLDPGLRRAGRFDREIKMGIPDDNARAEILKVMCRSLRLSQEFDFLKLARAAPGYVGADLQALTREAAMLAVNRAFTGLIQEAKSTLVKTEQKESVGQWFVDLSPLTMEQLSNLEVNVEDFLLALKLVQPSAKREGFATVPDVTWDDIGALSDIREDLKMSIMAPVRYPSQFKAMGLNRPAGILLCGPPGCGKTLLAKAIANEAGINFISVKGPELLNMYVGESERAVRLCFQRARNSTPCVIFFDELDALCPRRSDVTDGGSSSRIVNQLLTEMDGMDDRQGVYIMAATNRPDILDPAILRPGRMDKVLFVDLPSAQDRVEILKTITRNGEKPKLASDVDLSSLGSGPYCEGYSGADLSALVREASLSALKDQLSTSSPSIPVVAWCHFMDALKRIKASVSEKDRKKYHQLRLQFSTSQPS